MSENRAGVPYQVRVLRKFKDFGCPCDSRHQHACNLCTMFWLGTQHTPVPGRQEAFCKRAPFNFPFLFWFMLLFEKSGRSRAPLLMLLLAAFFLYSCMAKQKLVRGTTELILMRFFSIFYFLDFPPVSKLVE